MSRSSMKLGMRAAWRLRRRGVARFSYCLHEAIKGEAGSAALEQAMIVALLLLGTTSVVGSAANFFAMSIAHLVATITAVLPA